MGRRQAITVLAILVAAAMAYGLRTRWLAANGIGTYSDLTGEIRSNLAGTTTKCELGPPSPQPEANSGQPVEPRKLGRTPMAELLQRNDIDLSSEITLRLQDERFTTGLGAMSEAEQNIHLMDEMYGEVFNGGFHQFFSNPSGDCAARTRAAARAVDAALSQIYEQAVTKFPSSTPSEDRATRNNQMERVPDEFQAWKALDDRFYKLDMTTISARYIRANSTAFDSPLQELPGK